MFLIHIISTLPLSAETSEKVTLASPTYGISGGAVQNVTYRLLAVEQYFDSTPMKSAQYLIKSLTGYKNWQNVTWGGSKYTAYIHLLSYASIDSTLTQFYRGTPTNSNVVNEITSFLGQTGLGENNSLTIRIFYYNGHSGKQTINGLTNYYLCLGQSPYQSLYDYQLNKTLVSGDLKTSNCTLVVLDTCYSGGFITALASSHMFGQVVLTACTKDQLARGWITANPAPGYWAWFTGHSNPKYQNGSDFGPLGIIGGINAAKDKNGDGWRSAGEIFSLAKPTTENYAKDNGRTMNPQIDSGVLGAGIPIVMHQPYWIFMFNGQVFKFERWFVNNAVPCRMVVRPLDWDMFRYGPRRSGFSSAFGPGTSPLWIKSLTCPISSSAAINDGIVFVGTLGGGGGGGGGAALYALSWETGEILWKFTTDSQIDSSPAVVDGVVFFGTYDGRIYALEEYTGMVRWMNYTYGGGGVYSSPAVADGMVFIGSSNGYIHALNATTGWHMWEYNLGGPVDSSPAVVEGRVFVGTMGSPGLPCLYALSETTGLPIWSALTDNPVLSTPAVVDGLVFVGAMGGAYPPGIYAFYQSSGTAKWSYPLPAPVSSSPAVDSSKGLVIVGCMNGYIYEFNELTGPPIKWSYPTGGPVDRSSPAISSNEYVYVGSTDGYVYCLNEITGVKVWDYPTAGPVFSSPAITDDHIIIGSNDGNVYNFGPPLPAHDVAVLEASASPSTVFRGELVAIAYTVKNKGNVAETFQVKIAYNDTEVWVPPLYNDATQIRREEITELPPEAIVIHMYFWDTSSIPGGKYTISILAEPVSNETDTSDNDYMNGTVTVNYIGDFDGDFDVDYDDILYFVSAYIAYWSGGGNDPKCDFDSDGDIDYDDILTFVSAYIDYWTP